jgi:hypothetical protein
MEASRFDRLTKTLSSGGTRRGALRLLGALPFVSGLAALLDVDDAAAVNGRRKRRKRRHQHQKGDGKQNRKGKRKGGKGKHKGKAEACSAHSDCGADALCLSDGSCQECTVTCSGTPEACGTALQTALDVGGTVYVCPGTYQGGFEIKEAVTVIGAGQEDDAASNTILDGNDAARVVQINPGTGTVELAQVCLTGGDAGVDEGGSAEDGGGVQHQGTTLRMRDCTVTGNTAGDGGGISSDAGTTLELTRCTLSESHSAGGGGGISAGGTTTLTDCLIEGNDAPFGAGIVSEGLTTLAGSTEVRGNTANIAGGGILVGGGTLTIAETCRVTENTAGGGIFNQGGTVTLAGADPSPIVVDNCPQNCAGNPVPKCAPGGTCPP